MHDKRRFALCALLISLVATLASAQVYTITDLGSLSPTAINKWGQVVGNLNGQAFIWTRSAGPKGLGILPGGTFSYATSINDLGVVTGTANGPGTVISTDPNYLNQDCSDLTQPFIWTARTGMQGMGAITPPFSDVFYPYWCEEFSFDGTGINDPGQVVGFVGEYATYQWGFLWTRANGITVFGGSWIPTSVNAISNTGQIVGQNSQNDTYPLSVWLGHATSWKNGVATDLGTLGGGADGGYPFGYSSSANGVNDLGQIVGWSTTTPIPPDEPGPAWYGQSPVHALLWAATGGMRDFGTLPGDTYSSASKINFFGQVIGTSGNTAAVDPVAYNEFFDNRYYVIGRPFIWTKRSGMQDLNTLISATSGWLLNTATGINIWGQIVGSGTLNGQSHGFLLTPKKL
jgi:probable HAF family extracellular repeat protein